MSECKFCSGTGEVKMNTSSWPVRCPVCHGENPAPAISRSEPAATDKAGGVSATAECEVVAEVGKMPGTDGFTMACFRADAVPVGTKLVLATALDAMREELDKEQAHSRHLVKAMTRKINELIAAENQCSYYKSQYTRAETIRKEACEANIKAQARMLWLEDDNKALRARLEQVEGDARIACEALQAIIDLLPDSSIAQAKLIAVAAMTKRAALAAGGKHEA